MFIYNTYIPYPLYCHIWGKKKASGLDPVAKKLLLKDGRPPLPYDVLSLDIGSSPQLPPTLFQPEEVRRRLFFFCLMYMCVCVCVWTWELLSSINTRALKNLHHTKPNKHSPHRPPWLRLFLPPPHRPIMPPSVRGCSTSRRSSLSTG